MTKAFCRNCITYTVELSLKQVNPKNQGNFLKIVLLVGIIAVIAMRKKQEELNAEENPVYGVYQQTEAYERLYSTNEAVDNNNYYS